MASHFLVLASLIILLSTANLTVADESNILLTGETLATDGQLTYNDAIFVIQDDCNLVLYNKEHGFVSDTHGRGTKCTLTLNEFGQLIIRNNYNSIVWSNRLNIAATPVKGKYVAVLRPDGQVGIYGPVVWSSRPQLSFNFTTSVIDGAKLDAAEPDENINPVVRNVLFSSQTLYDNAKLTTRDYELKMGDDCNLALSKAGYGVSWQSGTYGKGKNCFVRLSHGGLLSVVSDSYTTVWNSGSVGSTAGPGEYVLLLQIDGQAVIYGPLRWSTSSTY